MWMSDDEGEFETADAGAADCYPVRAGEVKKGQFVVIKGHPCKVGRQAGEGVERVMQGGGGMR